MKLIDILKNISPKFKNNVWIICNNWRKKVQEGLKEMMKFGMLKETKIKFDINEAYTQNIFNLDLSEQEYLKYILFQNKNLLEDLRLNLSHLPIILNKLSSNKCNYENELQNSNNLKNFIELLMKQIPTEDIFHIKIKDFNTDIFGIYRIALKRNQSLFMKEGFFLEDYEVSVELFWAVIALFTERYNLNLEAVVVTILSHEYAHAYSHVGIDANKNHWLTPYFKNSEPLICEGIAEYFSRNFMYENDNGLNKFKETYDFILEKSPEIYKKYQEWEEPSLEAVRYAMMELRNQKEVKDYGFFMDVLEDGKKRYK